MHSLDIHTAAQHARIVAGDFDPERLTLFAPMRNEIRLLPAWLEHHRSIGFEQFLIWDDASDDGTSEFLQSQRDCVIMTSDFRFGDHLRYTDPRGLKAIRRAGTILKSAIPHALFKNAYVGYLDADEFLLLPPGVNSIRDVIDRLEEEKAPAILASVVEFFPETIDALKQPMPESFADLIAAYSYFQGEQLIAPIPEKNRPRNCNPSKTARLLAQYEISVPLTRKGLQKIWMSKTARGKQQKQTSPVRKAPLILRNENSFQVGSHDSYLPPTTSMVLTVAHFVFTAQSYEKAQRAIQEGSHAHSGRKYVGYTLLLEKMRKQNGSFLDENSVKYQGPQQFIDYKLMRWPG